MATRGKPSPQAYAKRALKGIDSKILKAVRKSESKTFFVTMAKPGLSAFGICLASKSFMVRRVRVFVCLYVRVHIVHSH